MTIPHKINMYLLDYGSFYADLCADRLVFIFLAALELTVRIYQTDPLTVIDGKFICPINPCRYQIGIRLSIAMQFCTQFSYT